MSLMKHLLVLSFVLGFCGIYAHASVQSDSQLWSISGYEFKPTYLKSAVLKAQVQMRYSSLEKKLNESQLNLSYQKTLENGSIGFVFTYGVLDSLNAQKEFRYALEYNHDVFKSSKVDYKVRFRHEMRDFSFSSVVAHRFRLLNRVLIKKYNISGFYPYIYSEFNFYINDFTGFDDQENGLSSHRLILGLVKTYKSYDLSFSYVYDYDLRIGPDFVRHAIAGVVIF